MHTNTSFAFIAFWSVASYHTTHTKHTRVHQQQRIPHVRRMEVLSCEVSGTLSTYGMSTDASFALMHSWSIKHIIQHIQRIQASITQGVHHTAHTTHTRTIMSRAWHRKNVWHEYFMHTNTSFPFIVSWSIKSFNTAHTKHTNVHQQQGMRKNTSLSLIASWSINHVMRRIKHMQALSCILRGTMGTYGMRTTRPFLPWTPGSSITTHTAHTAHTSVHHAGHEYRHAPCLPPGPVPSHHIIQHIQVLS